MRRQELSVPVHPVVELDGVEVQPPDLLGDAGGVAPRLVVRDEAVAWPRERVGEHVERARLAARLDAVAALWLRREGHRLARLDGDGCDQPVEVPQRHVGRIRDAADVDLDRVTGREGRLCRQEHRRGGEAAARVSARGSRSLRRHRLRDQVHRVRPEQRGRDRPPAALPGVDHLRLLRESQSPARAGRRSAAPARGPRHVIARTPPRYRSARRARRASS